VLLTSHLGRPKKGPEDKFRLNPVQPRLSELLGKAVEKADDCIGEAVTSKLAQMANGSVSGMLPALCCLWCCGRVLAAAWPLNRVLVGSPSWP